MSTKSTKPFTVKPELEPADYGDISALLTVMRQLRNPDGGCPWDLEQDFKSIAAYTVEEAYEVADAVERGDIDALVDELGDLLLQVVFHAQIGADNQQFEFADVVRAIVDKMIRRHPHVFGDEDIADAEAQTLAWEAIKAAERGPASSVLDGVAVGLPPMMRAAKLQKRAARVGFDWPDTDGVIDKLREEVDEVAEALDEADRNQQGEELGDLLFTCVNLARHLDVYPDQALLSANQKFERRFRRMEAAADLSGLDSDALEAHWQASKSGERHDDS